MKLRVMLAAIRVEKPELYRCHDIRRGHALDLQCAGVGVWSCWVHVCCFRAQARRFGRYWKRANGLRQRFSNTLICTAWMRS